ncbi:MAG: GNAT family N-acetyltransferase [Betaproteobacteria bacterium]|nr:MAG: GNAT family N-acetyltransferase [Betaproteobacteria bacterium]
MDRRISLERGAALDALVLQWEELAARAIEPNPFYEHWMLRPALAFLGGGEVEILCVWLGATLELLLPVLRLPAYRGLPLRAFSAWRHKHCLLGTPLVRSGCAPQALAALLDWMRKERAASILDLRYLIAGGPFHQALVEALERRGTPCFAIDAYTRPLLKRDRDAAAYVASTLSGESRKKLRRSERRLCQQGTLARRVLRPGDDAIGKWIDELLTLEASGWKGKRGSALACSEANRRFASEVFTRAFERGRLMMVGLDLDGRPIARYTAFAAGDGSFSFKTAYDEQLSRCSPGILAELEMIGAFHERAELQWMDSFTAPGNSTLSWLWKDRCLVQHLAVGVGAAGELALAALPLLQWAKRRWGQSICSVPKWVTLPVRPQRAT